MDKLLFSPTEICRCAISCNNTVSWNPLKIKESIRVFSEELIEHFQEKLTSEQERWQQNELEPFVSNRLKEMASKFEATITRILVDIEKIKLRIAGVDDTDVGSNSERIGALVAGFFGGGVAGAVVGGALGFSKEFIATLAAQIALGVILGAILGATNPITLIAIVVAGLIGMGAGLSKIESKIRAKIASQVTEQIRSEKDESIIKAVAILRDKLSNGTSNLSVVIDKELQSVEDLVTQIKEEKQQGEQHVQECIIKLEQNKNTLIGLLSNIKSFIKNMEEINIEFTPVQDENPTSGEMPNPQQQSQKPEQHSDNPQSEDSQELPQQNVPIVPSDQMVELCFVLPSKQEIGEDCQPESWHYAGTESKLYLEMSTASIICLDNSVKAPIKNWVVNENNNSMTTNTNVNEEYKALDDSFITSMVGQLIIKKYGIEKYLNVLNLI